MYASFQKLGNSHHLVRSLQPLHVKFADDKGRCELAGLEDLLGVRCREIWNLPYWWETNALRLYTITFRLSISLSPFKCVTSLFILHVQITSTTSIQFTVSKGRFNRQTSARSRSHQHQNLK